MTGGFTTAGKDTASDSERPTPREKFKQRMVSCVRDLQTKQVVHLILSRVILVVVRCVRCDRALTERMTRLHVVNDVRWVVEVAYTRGWLSPALSGGGSRRKDRRDGGR